VVWCKDIEKGLKQVVEDATGSAQDGVEDMHEMERTKRDRSS
jgi:hypothetical protein